MIDKKNFLFIPNWNGHLFLAEKEDTSIGYLYEKFNFENSQICKIEKNNFEDTQKEISIQYNQILDKKEIPFCIGGDHSNSFYTIEEFSKKMKNENKDFKLVIFDAHPDCEKDCGIVSHEDYVRFLVEKNVVNPKDIYIFGIRTFSRLELEFLKDNKINYFGILDLLDKKKEIEKLLENIKDTVYLSIDIDVLDPDVAPATYYQEHCGINLEELMNFISKINKDLIKSLDICEFYKEKENESKTTEKNLLKLISFLK